MVVSNMFYFHPYLGKIFILTNIFQIGWNHQLDLLLRTHWCRPMMDRCHCFRLRRRKLSWDTDEAAAAIAWAGSFGYPGWFQTCPDGGNFPNCWVYPTTSGFFLQTKKCSTVGVWNGGVSAFFSETPRYELGMDSPSHLAVGMRRCSF